MKKCETCEFFKPYEAASYMGKCHRYPCPLSKDSHDGCGEWKPRLLKELLMEEDNADL